MRIVICNTPPDIAATIANSLVKEGLAACVNIKAGIRSIYAWDGELCDDEESTLIIKVSANGVDALRRRIVQLHPFEVPEILVLGVDTKASHQPYVDWVRSLT